MRTLTLDTAPARAGRRLMTRGGLESALLRTPGRPARAVELADVAPAAAALQQRQERREVAARAHHERREAAAETKRARKEERRRAREQRRAVITSD